MTSLSIEVFGLFRLTVIIQQIWARYRAGQTSNPAFQGFGMAVNISDQTCGKIDLMKAGRITVSTRKFEVKDVPTPNAGPDQVRIKVASAGVCLSDVHFLDGYSETWLSTRG